MDTPPPPTEPVNKPSDKSTILDLLREAIGYENGLWRTFVDLRRKPREVLDSYLNGEKKYVSPFKLLTTALSIWVLINSFLIDWYAIWRSIAASILDLDKEIMFWITNPDAAKLAKLNTVFETKVKPEFVRIGGQIAGDVFAKLYVPFVIVVVVCGGYLSNRLTRKKEIGLRKMMSVISYSVASNIPLFLVITSALAIHVWLGFTLVLISGILLLSGRSQLITFSPMRNYFEHDGVAIEKKIVRANFLITLFLQVLLTAGYIFYFTTIDPN